MIICKYFRGRSTTEIAKIEYDEEDKKFKAVYGYIGDYGYTCYYMAFDTEGEAREFLNNKARCKFWVWEIGSVA